MGMGGKNNSGYQTPPPSTALPSAPRLNIKSEGSLAGDPQVTPLAVTNPIDNAINLPNQATETLGVGGVVRGNSRRAMGEGGGGTPGGRTTSGLPSSQNPLMINGPAGDVRGKPIDRFESLKGSDGKRTILK